jgi:hypothetical protein
MNAPVNTAVPQQHADQTFPYVLVVSVLGAIVGVAAVWLASLPIA